MEGRDCLILGIVALVVLISGCDKEVRTTPETIIEMTHAPIILESNKNIENIQEAESIFKENIDALISKVEESYPGLVQNKRIFLEDIGVDERAYIKNGKEFGASWVFETGETDPLEKEYFTFRIPMVSEGAEWKYEDGNYYFSYERCKNPSETISINVETGEGGCSSGIVTDWEKADYLNFIMDHQGKIYLGGKTWPAIV